MQWDELLSNWRFGREEDGVAGARASKGYEFRSAFEADYDRVVYSTPFRRLARKTQVHPMALNDVVHTRLTHSLEVASVGRSLGHRLGRFLTKRGELPKAVGEQDLLWMIQAACLAHDIGNPPFGHAGEFAIREWSRIHPMEVFGKEAGGVPAGLKSDFEIFEGNAQGFRIAARGDNPQSGYLRLTFATLGAMVKYPWDSTDPKARQLGKYNVFSTEKAPFEAMAARMGMRTEKGIVRHPLSFLCEAADDICYRILDIEDAVEMGILQEQKVREIYLHLAAAGGKDVGADKALATLRGQAIESLINGVWQVFENNYAAIMEGRREKDLKSDLPKELMDGVAEINGLYAAIFADRNKIAVELGAYKALGRIIKALCQATRVLSQTQDFGKTGFLARRCLELAWGEAFAKENQGRPCEWWLHQVLDYVSGLTDNYARQLSREIEGT